MFIGNALAAQPQHLSRKEVRRVLASAKDPQRLKELAAYYHYQKQLFQAKSEQEFEIYASLSRTLTTTLKIPTRTDASARLYEYYQFKAEQASERAAYCDQLLLESGAAPETDSLVIPFKQAMRQNH